jgi:hypothetical protein
MLPAYIMAHLLSRLVAMGTRARGESGDKEMRNRSLQAPFFCRPRLLSKIQLHTDAEVNEKERGRYKDAYIRSVDVYLYIWMNFKIDTCAGTHDAPSPQFYYCSCYSVMIDDPAIHVSILSKFTFLPV